MNKLEFLRENHNLPLSFILEKGRFFNFLNSHDLYFFKRESKFRETFNEKSVNLIDGFIISLFLSFRNFRKVKRLTGPSFTRRIFNEKVITADKKQLFIGLENSDLDLLAKKHPHLDRKKLFCHNPPFIKDIEFPREEINKIAKIINSQNIDYIWVGIGCPKQNILAYELSKVTKSGAFLNVGAALDFILERKKPIPKVFGIFGLDWLYRLITDFSHSKKKVIRSFLAIKYLISGVEIKD